jgi:hypothetical protein
VTFAQNKKFCPQKRILGAWAGCGDVTSLYKNLVKIEKLTFVGRRFKGPIFLWLMRISKAVAMSVVAACGIFLVR